MTIQEAANRWNVKENTVFDYISKGYIYGLAIENNEIIIPDIPKPYVKPKPKTVAEYDKYILTSMNKECYVNAKIMGIDQERFAERLEALIKADKIFPKDEEKIDFISNLAFALCSTETLNRNINITANMNIESLLKVNATGQIDLVNTKVGHNEIKIKRYI